MPESLLSLIAYYFGISDEAFDAFSENRNRLFISHQVSYLEIDLNYPLYDFLY